MYAFAWRSELRESSGSMLGFILNVRVAYFAHLQQVLSTFNMIRVHHGACMYHCTDTHLIEIVSALLETGTPLAAKHK